jgi:hypothetical protein
MNINYTRWHVWYHTLETLRMRGLATLQPGFGNGEVALRRKIRICAETAYSQAV